jgi:hypothetical protein
MKSASLAAEIDDDLIRIQDYWQQLRRGENSIPFSDDINLASLPGTAQRTLLIEVFYDPLRFRIDIAGARVEEQYGGALAGRFLDEVTPHAPLEGLSVLCQTAVNKHMHCYEIRGRGDQQYARLVLPFWGNGHVDMLLVAIAPRPKREGTN